MVEDVADEEQGIPSQQGNVVNDGGQGPFGEVGAPFVAEVGVGGVDQADGFPVGQDNLPGRTGLDMVQGPPILQQKAEDERVIEGRRRR